ncbi:MAG: DUF3343 domain-containing protein [Clostridiaceae bacterium]
MYNIILTFENTHRAIESESKLNEKGFKITVIPTPTFITKSCGISIKMEEKYLDEIIKLKKDKIIKINKIYNQIEKTYIVVGEDEEI